MRVRDIEVPWARACDGLGLSRGSALDAAEGSVLLKYIVAEAAAAPGAPTCTAMGRARCALRPWLEGGLASLAPALDRRAIPRLEGALRDDPCYADRVVDLAVSDLVSEPMAPEVCIDPEPWQRLPADGSTWVHAVVFCAAPLITHEIYPLAADACVHGARRGAGPRIRVVGVHGDWLRAGAARRVLALDTGTDRFREAWLETPLTLDSAQLLALGERQAERHRCWDAALDCPVLNPWPASALADDKHGLVGRWRAMGLTVPRNALLEPGDHDGAHRFVAQAGQAVIKPRAGTEGDRVLYVRAGGDDARAIVDAHLASCWEWGAAVVEQRRDGVAWLDRDGGRRRSLAIRIHVARGASGARAESGYAQVGADEDSPASRGRGGTLLPLQAVLSDLVCRGDGAPVRFERADLDGVRALAEAAADADDRLGLSGVDLVLDVEPGGAVQPVLLELNPRPAGLSHSRFLPGFGEGRCEAGVSLELWDGIACSHAHESLVSTPLA